MGSARNPAWHILGAGAIGSLFACKLARAGLDARLLVRGAAAPGGRRVIRLAGVDGGDCRAAEGGGHGSGVDGSGLSDEQAAMRETFAVPVLGAQAAPPSSLRRVLIVTKAFDAAAAFEGIAPALTEDAVTVLLHNGMGIHELLRERYPDVRFALGVTTEGAFLRPAPPRQPPGGADLSAKAGTGARIKAGDGDGESSATELVHAGLGDTLIGEPGLAEAPEWFAPLAGGGERIAWEPRIEETLWRKLAINCAINPLTALNRCPNGALLEDPGLRRQMRELCGELAAVLAAKGYDAIAADIAREAEAVARATAANRSSMLQDLAQGRPTEIRHITGHLCLEAARLGIPCPANRRLLDAVLSREPG